MDRVDYESVVVQDLENFYKQGELNLTPWYQRRSVWTPPQRSYLINTICNNKPIPTCYVRHYLDTEQEKSIKEIVDGQQRIRAILDFLKDAFPARVPGHKGKVKYSTLSRTERTDFRMKKISVGYLIGASDADVIDIFGRLNSVSKQLNEQEKRNARYSGAMKQFCLQTAAAYVDFWRSAGIFSATEISRMTEVQFVSDLVLNMVEGLSDYSSPRLNKFYEKYDESFDQETIINARIEKVFETLNALDVSMVRDTIFSRSPVFFSLFLLLDKEGSIKLTKLRERMKDIDAAFNNPDVPIEERSNEEQQFYLATTASTQRVKNRAIRLKYLKRHIYK